MVVKDNRCKNCDRFPTIRARGSWIFKQVELWYLHWFLSRVWLRLTFSLASFVLLGVLAGSVGMVRVHVVGVVRS